MSKDPHHLALAPSAALSPTQAGSLRRPLALLLSAALFSCASLQPGADVDPYVNGHILSPTRATSDVSGRSTWKDPVRVPGRDELLFPFAVEREVWLLGDQDHFAEGGFSNELTRRERNSAGGWLKPGATRLRWHNAVVADIATGVQWALLDRRGVLSSAWTSEGASPPETTTLLLRATVDDTNSDGTLDDEDASRALLVDFDARTARFVTPADLRLHSVDLETIPDAALLMLAADEDGDGEFEVHEAPRPYLLDLRTGLAARPLIGGDLAREIEGRMKDD
ncbi:MAG: hypothetical protein AAFU73_01530 [Planctomycetota bacterium]